MLVLGEWRFLMSEVPLYLKLIGRILVQHSRRPLVYGLWFMVYGLWFMVYGLWFRVYGLWFMVNGLWCIIYGVWFMVYGSWFMVHGSKFLVSGFWFLVYVSRVRFMVYGFGDSVQVSALRGPF